MSQPDLFVDINVAKGELVIHARPAGTLWRVTNTKAGLAALGRKLARLTDTACVRVGFRASGGYELKLAILLDRIGLVFASELVTTYFESPSLVGDTREM